MAFLTPLQLARIHKPDYQVTPHLKLLQRFVLEILREPGPAKGIVMMSPRHGKSELLSKTLPPWYLMTYPDRNVILTSYGNEFAASWGRKAREIFARHAPRLFGLRLDSRHSKAHQWSVDRHGGSMETCGTLGSITGKGCSLLISDDQYKDQAQANSPTQRASILEWFEADALSRLTPDGKCILVMSRRHQDDLPSRLIEKGGWRTLRLPALADSDDDPLGRADGEPLWGARYDKAALLRIRDDLEQSGHSYIWNCLWQQSPTGDPAACEFPPEYFKDVWCPGIPTEGVRLRVLACDPSKGRRAHTGDYTAFVHLVLTHTGHVYVQSWLRRIPLDKIEDEAVRLLEELRPDGFIYESIGFQELLGKNIIEKCQQKGVPCPIWQFCEMEDKLVRIRTQITPLLAQRRLHLDETSPGNRLLLNQLREFPTGAHDDGPDSLTMGLYLLNQLLTGKKVPQNLILRA